MNVETALTEAQVSAKAKQIKLLVLDVDGVLTDGKLYFNNEGQETKAFSTLDGHGIKLLRQSGVEVGIITGRSSQLVANRAKDLGIRLLIQGREDKFVALQEMLTEFACELDEIAYVGDDHPDLLVMTKVGLAFSVPNGHRDVQERAHWITQRRGGEGAVREVIDMIMQAQDTYELALAKYIN